MMPAESPGTKEQSSPQATSQPKLNCGRTANMRVYSDAYLSEETGDVGGIELAIAQKHDSTVDALMFIYESAPTDDAIPLTGSIAKQTTDIEG